MYFKVCRSKENIMRRLGEVIRKNLAETQLLAYARR